MLQAQTLRYNNDPNISNQAITLNSALAINRKIALKSKIITTYDPHDTSRIGSNLQRLIKMTVKLMHLLIRLINKSQFETFPIKQ